MNSDIVAGRRRGRPPSASPPPPCRCHGLEELPSTLGQLPSAPPPRPLFPRHCRSLRSCGRGHGCSSSVASSAADSSIDSLLRALPHTLCISRALLLQATASQTSRGAPVLQYISDMCDAPWLLSPSLRLLVCVLPTDSSCGAPSSPPPPTQQRMWTDHWSRKAMSSTLSKFLLLILFCGSVEEGHGGLAGSTDDTPSVPDVSARQASDFGEGNSSHHTSGLAEFFHPLCFFQFARESLLLFWAWFIC